MATAEKAFSGNIRLLVGVGLPTEGVGALFALLRSTMPEVHCHATFVESPLEEDIENYDILGWFGLTEPGSGWQTHTIMPVRHRLFASESYIQDQGVPKTLEELRQRPIFAWLPKGDTEAKLITSGGTTHRIRPVLSSANVDIIHECVSLGLGIGWAPDGGLPPHPFRERLIPILTEFVGHETELRLAVPERLAENPQIKALIEGAHMARDLVLAGSQD